jgi:hypothetical protein
MKQPVHQQEAYNDTNGVTYHETGNGAHKPAEAGKVILQQKGAASSRQNTQQKADHGYTQNHNRKSG